MKISRNKSHKLVFVKKLPTVYLEAYQNHLITGSTGGIYINFSKILIVTIFHSIVLSL
jgi:hypothetical protein